MLSSKAPYSTFTNNKKNEIRYRSVGLIEVIVEVQMTKSTSLLYSNRILHNSNNDSFSFKYT